MDDEVAVLVAREGQLESHVGEERVAVHPPDPLDLRVGEHEAAEQRQLGPVPGELGVEVGEVVDDLDAVEAAVVDLVLGGLEQVVVAERVVAGPRLRARDEQDPGLAAGDGGREPRVLPEPAAALTVPVGDLGAERVAFDSGGVGRRRLRGVERGGVEGAGEVPGGGGVVVGAAVGADLAEDAVDVLDGLGAGERVGVGGLVGEGEVEADGAAEDEDGDEAAEHGDLDVVEGAVDLARAVVVAVAAQRRRPTRPRRRHRQPAATASSPLAVVVPHPFLPHSTPNPSRLGFISRAGGIGAARESGARR